MNQEQLIAFPPAPVRARHDGWTPGIQRRFILELARGHGPAQAAKRVGRSRQTAYALRRKPGAEGFAAAWDAAERLAQTAREAAGAGGLLRYGEDMLLVPRFYRGRLIGFVRRDDHSHALRTLKALDRIADRLDGSETVKTDAIDM